MGWWQRQHLADRGLDIELHPVDTDGRDLRTVRADLLETSFTTAKA